MGKIITPAILVFLLACNSEPRPDTRPAEQQSFISIVKAERDQAERMTLTDPNRPVVIDDGVKRVKKHILDTLKLSFKEWNVRVLDNKRTDPNGSDLKITFGMSINNFDLQETARFKSIVFVESLSYTEASLRAKLQALKVGDHVQISGSFITRDKMIDVDPYNEKEFKLSKNIFANPEFRVEISDVKPAD